MPAVVVDERRLRRLPVEAFTSEAKEGIWDLAVAKGHSTYKLQGMREGLVGLQGKCKVQGKVQFVLVHSKL